MELPIWKAIHKTKLNSEQEVRHFLHETALFAHLHIRALRTVAKLLHKRHYGPGEVIFSQGEAGAGLYLIKSGKVSISAYKDEEEIQLAELGAGAFFGELSLFSEEKRTATATAEDDSELFGFFKPDLINLIETKPKIGIEIIMSIANIIADRLSKTNQVLEKAYFKGKKKNVPV